MIEVTAAVLAGGFGTRLRSVLPDRPKVLAEIRGRPFLAYLLDQLASAGVRNAVICTGYLGEQVRSTFGDSYTDIRLVYSQESSPLGTAGALGLALPLFESDSVLVMNGDSFYGINLRLLWEWHCLQRANATIALVNRIDTARYGQIQVNGDGVVISFNEKGTAGGSGWINAGIYLIMRSLLLTIPADRYVSLEQEMFPAWAGRGLYGYRSEGRFVDIGTPDAYKSAERFFASEAP
jgi:NDP-sugar pyrophosphorylase family protein